MPSTQTARQRSKITFEIIEYNPDSPMRKTVIKKNSGTVSTASLNAETTFDEHISPYESFLQVVEGKAMVIIDGDKQELESGQGISIPANQAFSILSKERFKMILTNFNN